MVIKYGYEFGCLKRLLTSSYILLSNKTRLHMLYFDSYTTIPFQYAALDFWQAYVDRMLTC